MMKASDKLHVGGNHRRILSVLMRVMEATCEEIQHGLRKEPGILWQVKNDLTREEQERLRGKLERFRSEIRRIASEWDLEETTFNARRSIIVQLSSAIVNLEDSDSSRLKGYGGLSEEAKIKIDEELRHLAILLEGMMKDLTSQ